MCVLRNLVSPTHASILFPATLPGLTALVTHPFSPYLMERGSGQNADPYQAIKKFGAEKNTIC
jgi:hypothetical protein